MKNILLISLLAICSIGFAQEKVQEVKIKTSSECGECKIRLEEKLNYTKGIVYVDLDVESKILTVRYKPLKISVDQIKTIISELGYDADEMKANPESQNKLPKCCRPGGM